LSVNVGPGRQPAEAGRGPGCGPTPTRSGVVPRTG
jgi:hypothetical protein